MNHAGEKVFKALAIAFGIGLLIVAIIAIYLAAKLGDYEFRLSEVEYRVDRLYWRIKGLEERIERVDNQTWGLTWWATDADIRIRDIETKIEDFENLSGWRLEDIFWKILELEADVKVLEDRIELLETP